MNDAEKRELKQLPLLLLAFAIVVWFAIPAIAPVWNFVAGSPDLVAQKLSWLVPMIVVYGVACGVGGKDIAGGATVVLLLLWGAGLIWAGFRGDDFTWHYRARTLIDGIVMVGLGICGFLPQTK